jgi:hypothetical protein
LTLLHGECFYIPLSFLTDTGGLVPDKIYFENRGNKIINFLINQLLAVPLMPRPVICALLTKTIA